MIADALAPIFLLILIGFCLSRFRFPGGDFWIDVEKLTYFVLFPALLIYRLALADFNQAPVSKIITVVLVSLTLVSIGLFLLRPWLKVNAPTFTSIFQGGLRFNTYVGLAGAQALYGEQGLALASVIAAILIPFVNVLSVMSFTVAGVTQDLRIQDLLKTLFTNPLILACGIGIFLNQTSLGLSPWIGSTLAILSAAALPLGLLAVGAAINLRALQRGMANIVTSSLTKFIVLPGLMLGISLFLEVENPTRQILVLFACLPTASSAYILARQLNGDVDLMANTITIQTLLGFIAIPLWLSLSNYIP